MCHKLSAVALLVVLPLLGCGTLFNKDIKTLPVRSEPSGADIYVNNNRVGTTPDTVELDNNKSHVITLRKEGYKETACEVRSSAKAGWILLDVLLGVVGIVVDAVTGEWSGISQDGCDVRLPEVTATARGATNIGG